MAQDNWRWCNQCQGLFFAGYGLGVCPVKQKKVHNAAGSGNYLLSQSGGGQPNWQWCKKCQGLYFAGQGPGLCPSGTTHAGGGNYHLETSGSGQPNWRWCKNCEGLFFAGNSMGVCPKGQAHVDSGSGNYVLASLPMPTAGPGSHQLNAGDQLTPGQSLISANGDYMLILQGDGNLVLYAFGEALWNSGTNGKPSASAVMQSDGNFVVYDAAHHALWNSKTSQHPGGFLVLQDDGNVVIYAEVPLFATNTAGA